MGASDKPRLSALNPSPLAAFAPFAPKTRGKPTGFSAAFVKACEKSVDAFSFKCLIGAFLMSSVQRGDFVIIASSYREPFSAFFII